MDACAIATEEAIIITGGDTYEGYLASSTRVIQYDINGTKTLLPKLNSKRSDHACGSYMDANNKRVLIVAGGASHSSTEILFEGHDTWQYRRRLPFDLQDLAAATINNQFYVFGGEMQNDAFGNVLEASNEIYKFNPDEGNLGVWELVGQMKEKRQDLGVSLVKLSDVIDYCQVTEEEEKEAFPSHPHLMRFVNTKTKKPDVEN